MQPRTGRQPVVSVITPFLNAGPFLSEAIDSVVAQRYGPWELLLVDDGSSDGSARVGLEAARHPRIRYLEHPGHANLGKSTSRNLGIAEARGRYLAFLDADDVFLPEKLAHQVALLDARPEVVMTYGTTEYWFDWNEPAADSRRNQLGKLGVEPGNAYAPPSLLTAYLRDPGIVPCICALLARREVVLAAGCFDESFQDLYEDQVLIAKMVLSGAVYVDAACGERYRQHDESSSAIAEREGRYHPTRPNHARKAFLEWVEAYVTHLRLRDRGLDRAIESALRPYRPSAWRGLLATWRNLDT